MAPQWFVDHQRTGARCALFTAALVLFVVTAKSGAAQSPEASGMATPLPVWIAEGTCEGPGQPAVALDDATAPAVTTEGPSVVYLSVTELRDPVAALLGAERVVLAGGSDAESAVVCGSLQPARGDGSLSVAVLGAIHDTQHVGTVLLRDTDQGAVVEVIVVAPSSPEPQASSSPSPSDESTSPDPSELSPVRSPRPGTSGAPPFSPLPGGGSAP